MVGILIFVVAILIYFQFINDFSFETQSALDDVLRDAKIISNSLLTAGYPLNWNSTTVSRIGVTNDNQRINTTKLSEFKSIDYNASKQLFSITSDYFIYFEKGGIKTTIGDVDDIGVNSSSYDHLAAITRIVFWNGTIYEMKVQTWK